MIGHIHARLASARCDTPPGRRRGLTLIEVLVAVAMLMALTTVMFSFYFNLLESRVRVIEFTSKQRAAGMMIERLESDLVTTLAGNSRHGPGVEGDEHDLRMLGRGVAAYRAENGPDDPGVLGDLQFVQYRYDPVGRTLTARRRALGVDDDSAEDDRDQSMDDDAELSETTADTNNETQDAATQFETIGSDLGRVRFRYHDGNGWRASFNSLEAGQLPVAIEVSVWFEPWPGEEDAENLRAAEAQQQLERETFDFEPAFDEEQYLREQEAADQPEPTPDRRRVIVIPDARPEDGAQQGGEVAEDLAESPNPNGGGP